MLNPEELTKEVYEATERDERVAQAERFKDRRVGSKLVAQWVTMPAEIATDSSGNPAKVLISTRIKRKYKAELMQITGRAMSVQSIQSEYNKLQERKQVATPDQEKSLEQEEDVILAKMNQAMESISSSFDETNVVLAKIIRDWTIADAETLEPLPNPYENSEAFDELDEDAFSWIMKAVQGSIDLQATEGNEVSTIA